MEFWLQEQNVPTCFSFARIACHGRLLMAKLVPVSMFFITATTRDVSTRGIYFSETKPRTTPTEIEKGGAAIAAASAMGARC